MVDIAMCSRRDCPDRNTCYRYLAEADEDYQSYIVVDKPIISHGECEMYWRCRNMAELKEFNRLNKMIQKGENV